jgi:hypothetical protein
VTWWALLLLWLVLLLLAVTLVAVVALRVFRRGTALLAEIGAAADQLTAALEGRTPASDAGTPRPRPRDPSATRRAR